MPKTTNDIDESSLIARCRAGDRSAFDLLIRRYQDLVYRVALRILQNPSEAEDIAQEVFIRMYRGIESFRGDALISTWLYRITTNLCLNALRSARVASFLSFDGVEDLYVASADQRPDLLLENDELRSLIDHAIAKLPPKQKSVFVLRYTEELSYEEIRDILGGTVGGLKANYFHAIRKIEREVRHAMLPGSTLPL